MDGIGPGRRRSAIRGAILAALVLAAGGCSRPEKVRIKGSDTMVEIDQAWAEAWLDLHPDVNMTVKGGGSGTGIAALFNGTCELAASSRDVKDVEKQKAAASGMGLEPHVVGLDGIVVVVNPRNPVKELTLDQIADVFTGALTNWRQVGGEDAQIELLSREVNSGTHIYFKESVLRLKGRDQKAEFSEQAKLMVSSRQIATHVASNKAAIGYYGLGYLTNEQKAIAVGKSPKGPFVAPSIDTIRSSAYPISRPLYFFTAGRPKPSSKAFLDFVLSKPGQEILRSLDFVPVN